jgi:glutathione S-transferase
MDRKKGLVVLKLYIGNKNYSSWSMRPWVLLKHFGIPFEEIMVRFDGFNAGSQFRTTISSLSPTGKVPLLQDGSLTVWDTLAIAEYAAEYAAQAKPSLTLWPSEKSARARARSICAEMHSGFSALRSHCMMNIEASLKDVGAIVMRDQEAVRRDVARVESIWQECLAQYGGPYLFGQQFTIADAYYAPVCMRFRTYGLSSHPTINQYTQTIADAPGVREWIADALAEKDFLDFEEPYRLTR